MGEIRATTFLDEIEARHDAFRPIEDAGADFIRRDMLSVKREMSVQLITGSETITREGRYLTTAAAQKRAQGLINDLDSILSRGISKVDGSLLPLKEAAFQKGVRD